MTTSFAPAGTGAAATGVGGVAATAVASRALPDWYGAAVHRRQRGYLRNVVRLAFPDQRPVQHDYGCGAGRSLRLMHGVVCAAHGYDTSTAALLRAGQYAGHARLHQLPSDGRGAPAAAPSPAVVTLFGLWRDGATRWHHALAFATKVLAEPASGLLMLENDTFRGGPRDRDVVRLLGRYGFEVVLRRGFAILSPHRYANPLLRHVVRLLDDAAARWSWLAGYRGRVVYVARRMPRLHPPRAIAVPRARARWS